MFSIDFSILDYCLFGSALVCAVLALALMLPRVSRVARRVRADRAVMRETGGGLPDEAYPPVSVIVTADEDSENLAELLPAILEQDYPGPMEVIVVDNGEGGPLETVIARLQPLYPNLYLTFAPANSRNLSRKKLAITIGVKAARFDNLLLTNGNCRIPSALWLRTMARHFAMGKEIVAGYSVPVPADKLSGRESRLEAFDRVRRSLQWLAPAIAGKLQRADGNNLGYTRRLFYDNRGFQRSLNLKYGDDDIFVNEIATPSNFAVELAPCSFVADRKPDVSNAHRIDRLHRDFTASRLPKSTRRLWGLVSLLWWAGILLGVAAAVTALPNLIPAIAVVALWIIAWLVTGLVWVKAQRALKARRLCFTVAWFITIHPFYTLAYRFRGHRARYNNFTWTTEK